MFFIQALPPRPLIISCTSTFGNKHLSFDSKWKGSSFPLGLVYTLYKSCTNLCNYSLVSHVSLQSEMYIVIATQLLTAEQRVCHLVSSSPSIADVWHMVLKSDTDSIPLSIRTVGQMCFKVLAAAAAAKKFHVCMALCAVNVMKMVYISRKSIPTHILP